MDKYIAYIVVGAIAAGIIPALIARGKGRNFFTWWIYGAVLFVAALPHSLLLKGYGGGMGHLFGPMRKCGYCGTMNSASSPYCKKCGYEFIEM